MSYKYAKIKCPDCGKTVARNWLLRYWRDECPGLVEEKSNDVASPPREVEGEKDDGRQHVLHDDST